MRSSHRARWIAAITVGVVTLGACRLFVDLDDLGPPGASANTDGSTTGDGASNDGGTSGDGTITSDGSITDTGTRDVELPPPDGACARLGGPLPIRAEAGAVTVCIDSTEVTNEQYVAFLASNPTNASAPPTCQWKTTYVPGGTWPANAGSETIPVSHVDWCDAYVFCKWSGKHLCGAIGGGPINSASIASVTTSEWAFACTGGGQTVYPYGNAYDPIACNGADLGANKLVAAGSLPKCQGGFPGIFDMSGSNHEWINSCDDNFDSGTNTAGEQPCAVQDSAWPHSQADMACTNFYLGLARNERSNEIGFRCCSP